MKISPTSNSFNLKNSQPTQNQTFKGLWGKNDFDVYDTLEFHSEDTTLNYYPFKDETMEEISAIRDKYSRIDSYSPTAQGISSPVTNAGGTSVRVHEAIPFTKKEFSQYLDKTLSTVRRYSLEKYMKQHCLHI